MRAQLVRLRSIRNTFVVYDATSSLLSCKISKLLKGNEIIKKHITLWKYNNNPRQYFRGESSIISHVVSEESQLHNDDDDSAGPQATCKLSGVTTKSYV